MNWHNVTKIQPKPEQAVTVFTKSGETVSEQTWDNDSRTFMPSGLGVEEAVWWELSTELSTGGNDHA